MLSGAKGLLLGAVSARGILQGGTGGDGSWEDSRAAPSAGHGPVEPQAQGDRRLHQ